MNRLRIPLAVAFLITALLMAGLLAAHVVSPTAAQSARNAAEAPPPTLDETVSLNGLRGWTAAAPARTDTAGQWRLKVVDADSLTLLSQTDLRSLTYVPPYTALDPVRRRFFAGYMQRAEVDIYSLDGPLYHTFLPFVRRWGQVGPSATPTPTATRTPTPTATQSPTPTPTATATATPGSPRVDPDWGPEHQATFSAHYAGGVVGRNLAVDAAGRVHIAWVENSGNVYDVLYSRSTDGGQTWSAPLDLANSPLPANSPNLMLGPDGTLHAIWNDLRDGGSGRLYYSRSTDAGLTWAPPRDVTGAHARKVGGFSFGLDLQNRLHLAWHYGDPSVDTAPTEVYYLRSTDGGDTFGSRQKLNQGGGHAAFPRFTIEGTDGNLIAIAWRDNRANPDWDTYVAVSTDGGQTFTERVGAATPARDWDPEAAVDAHGVIHLGVMTTQMPYAAIDYRRSTDGGLTWSAAVTLSEANSRFPFWALDNPHGVLWLFWKDERDFLTPACPSPNRCADIAGKFSTDGGLTWSALEFVTDLGAVEVKFPAFAVDAGGRPHALWSDRRTGDTVENVYVRSRLSAP